MLFPIFVIATLAELYVLMTIGSSIGAGNTILLVDPKCRALIYCRVFQTCSKDETQVLECMYGRFVCF
jgi:hypothetical protein